LRSKIYKLVLLSDKRFAAQFRDTVTIYNLLTLDEIRTIENNSVKLCSEFLYENKLIIGGDALKIYDFNKKISYTVEDAHHSDLIAFLTVMSYTLIISASRGELILWDINFGLKFRVAICEFLIAVLKLSNEKFAICYLSGTVEIRNLNGLVLNVLKVDSKLLYCQTISESQILTCSLDSTVTV
jgi:hypothetical protein